jgi:hypothetical protein
LLRSFPHHYFLRIDILAALAPTGITAIHPVREAIAILLETRRSLAPALDSGLHSRLEGVGISHQNVFDGPVPLGVVAGLVAAFDAVAIGGAVPPLVEAFTVQFQAFGFLAHAWIERALLVPPRHTSLFIEFRCNRRSKLFVVTVRA